MFDKESYWANRKAGKRGQGESKQMVKLIPHYQKKTYLNRCIERSIKPNRNY